MTCCATGLGAAQGAAQADAARAEELRLATETVSDGVVGLRLAAPGLHCGACVATVEKALAKTPGVLRARANLTRKTIAVDWRADAADPAQIVGAVEEAGYQVFPLDEERAVAAERAAERDLLVRMAVAGFASANVMLLSVSIWSGADGATRDLMHWLSAAIALPTVIYSGRPFFTSAWSSLRRGRLNMDCPISLAIILAVGVSISETIQSGPEAYFDAACSLIFLLLIGRWLDRAMRGKARSAARSLARLAPRGAWVLDADGRADYRPIASIRPGDLVRVAAGERAAVDGVVVDGAGALDRAFLTGESAPAPVQPGDAVEAGALSVDGALTLRATAVGEDTTLAEISRLVGAAEDKKSKLARLADKAASIYAPLIHLVGAATLIGWVSAGADWRTAILHTAALLIVTCPCALGLAAPMAQAVASGALFRRGLMLKDGAALERLAKIDAACFDKTGVLTDGSPVATPEPGAGAEHRAVAAALAGRSSHPFSRAIADWAVGAGVAPASVRDVVERPGAGVEGALGDGRAVRLGSADFCGVGADAADDAGADAAVWVRIGDGAPARFRAQERLREGAREAVAELARAGVPVRILSGDRAGPVNRIAEAVGVADARAGLSPQDKISEVAALGADGRRVLMVGDGVNDAPALAAADVSIAPASAADVGRAAADIVFVGERLDAITEARAIARKTRAVILQNFALAAIYNCIAIPIAASGHAGPLEAAIAMSTSSIIVTLNALRLARVPRARAAVEPRRDRPSAAGRPSRPLVGEPA